MDIMLKDGVNKKEQIYAAIDETAEIISFSSYQIYEKADVYNCRLVPSIKDRESVIEIVGRLLELELSILDKLMYEIGKYVFDVDENIDWVGYYQKLDGIAIHVNAVQKYAEIKRYLDARNYGLMGKFPGGSDRQN
jgi:hypothetical protein